MADDSIATPGPWTFHRPWAGFSKITGPNGELIFGIAAGTPEEKQPDEVCYANARMLQAARSLYDALANLTPRFERACKFAGSDDEFIAEATVMARAALALARGEAP